MNSRSAKVERKRIRICVLRVGGTNRDADVACCLADLGVVTDVVHLDILLRRGNLENYHGLVIPGGFAYGDYVRAGAILGSKLKARLGDGIRSLIESRKPVLGICNGFQVLVEAGLLPTPGFPAGEPEVALSSNMSGRFECRWVKMRTNFSSPCVFTKHLPEIVSFPVAHGEGRFVASDKRALNRLFHNNQVALRYADGKGAIANGRYPDNPNGSDSDIAGICDPSGLVFGLMPHPENAYFGYQLPAWTSRGEPPEHGDGYQIFNSMVSYIERSVVSVSAKTS